MRIRLSLFGCLVTAYLSAQQFTAYRQLEVSQPGWYQLVPNAQFAAELKPNFVDLRILGITTNGDTLEAPWMPERQKAINNSEWRSFEIINQSRRAEHQYYTLRYAETTSIQAINLDLQEDNFDYHLNLEGRNNQEQEWFTILQQYRLVGYSDEQMSFKKSTLHFKPQQFQEYRISFKPVSDHRLLAASYPYKPQPEQTFHIIDTNTFRLNKDLNRSNKKVDFYQLSFKQNTCFNAIQVQLAAKYDYLRQVFIYQLGDSVMVKNQPIAHYDYLEQVYFHNFGDSLITLSENYCGCEFEIRIKHNDNQPIPISKFLPLYKPESILLRIDQPANWQLFYGDARLSMPDYDIRRLGVNPMPTANLNYGDKQIISPTTGLRPTTSARPWMLWLIMSIIGALIVFFAFQLLTKPVDIEK